MKSDRGFTLLELIIVLGIGFLVMACSLPGLASSANQERLKGTTLQFVDSCRLAREKTISHGKRYEVRVHVPHNRWEVYTVDWDGGVPKEVLVKSYPIDPRIRIQNPHFFGSNRFKFDTDGSANVGGTVEFVEVKSRNRNKYTVRVTAGTGLVTVIH